MFSDSHERNASYFKGLDELYPLFYARFCFQSSTDPSVQFSYGFSALYYRTISRRWFCTIQESLFHQNNIRCQNGQRPGYFHKYDQTFENEGLKMQLRTGKMQY